jgi:putative transport protein
MSSLQAVFVIAAIGYIVGSVTVKEMRLGASGVLLVALFFGHIGYEIPPIIGDLGLVLFIASVGLTSGPSFFRNLKQNALSYGVIAATIIASATMLAVALRTVFSIPKELATGIFTGALTTTPGLAAALKITGNPNVSVGYGIAYPFGVTGKILLIQALPRLAGKNLKEEVEKHASTKLSQEGSGLVVREFIVEKPEVDRKTLAELGLASRTGALVSRVMRGRHIVAALGDTTLLNGDYIRAVGTEEALKRLSELIGPMVKLSMDEPGLEVRDLAVESKEAAGVRLRELGIYEKYGVILTRVMRTGIEFTPSGETVLEMKDIVRVVGPRFAVDRFQDFLGIQRRTLGNTGLVPLSLVISFGIFLGGLKIPVPGAGSISLGLTGGPLLASLLIGHIGSVGPWSLRPSGQFLRNIREFGLMLFLAGAGVSAGHGFVPAVSRYGWKLFLMGAFITLIPMSVGFLVAHKGFKLAFIDTMGCICGGTTSTPALGALITAAGADEVATAYAAIYPFALVLVVIASSVLPTI